MKHIKIVISLLVLSAIVPQTFAATIVRMEDVPAMVRRQNLLVLENANRVYQSREAIRVARMNLLPRLNLWRWVSVIFDWRQVTSLIEDIAPFLVPANWFRVREYRLLAEAEKYGYQALSANELLTAKSIYLTALADELLLQATREVVGSTQMQLDIARNREALGSEPVGTAADLEIRLLGLKDDVRSLESLIIQEKQALKYALGIPMEQEIDLFPVPAENAKEVDFDTFFPLVEKRAPELAQYGYFIRAAGTMRREVIFSFLGASSLSRGVNGGIFDTLPQSDGLGFGAGASIRIARSQQNNLRLQATGIKEILKRQLQQIDVLGRLGNESLIDARNRVTLASDRSSQLMTRLQLGEEVSVLQLNEASKNVVEAKAALYTKQSELAILNRRLERLLMENQYQPQ